MVEVISNVGNKYLFGKESTYGATPVSITALDLGHVQTISISEAEGTEGVLSINSLHNAIMLEDGVYNLTGSIVTRCTKASLPVILEGLLGAKDDDTPSPGKYTISSDPIHSDDLSYFLKFNTETGELMIVNGLCFTGGELNISSDGYTEVTLNWKAQVMKPATASLSVSTNTGALFKGLDGTVTYGGSATILNTFNISVDWNIDEADCRGIETAHANGRRVIKRIVRNGLTLTGNFESQMDGNIDTGYEDERIDKAIVLTLSRGTSNSHAFTISNARTSTRTRDLTNENTSKKISCEFIGLDLSVVGDLFDESP